MSLENMSEQEERLLYLLRTKQKIAKVRRLYSSGNGSPIFKEVERLCSAVEFPVSENEFAFINHMTDAKLGRPLRPLSRIYFNFRNCSGEELDLMGQVLANMSFKRKPFYCTGIPTTGEDIAKSFSYWATVPYVSLLQKSETDLIIPKKDAPFGDGAPLFIFDDVMTRGTTGLPAILAAKKQKFEIAGIIVLVNREEGGIEFLRSLGYPVYFWQTGRRMLDYYLHQTDESQISRAQYDDAIDSLIHV